jgi:hypothetical protein
MMFSRPDNSGFMPKVGSSSEPTSPVTFSRPPTGSKIPAKVRSSVVLPAPLPPTSASRSPGLSVKDTLRKACTTTRFCRSALTRPEAADSTIFFRLRALPW